MNATEVAGVEVRTKCIEEIRPMQGHDVQERALPREHSQELHRCRRIHPIAPEQQVREVIDDLHALNYHSFKARSVEYHLQLAPITNPILPFNYPTASAMGTKFPSEPTAAMLNLSILAQLLGLAIITWCITQMTKKYPLLAKKTWTSTPWARVCLLLVLIDAWLFLIITSVLLHGAPRQHESHRCSIGIILCLVLYAANKCLVYLCLTERVRAVWSNTRQRWRSPVYLFCLSLLLPFFGTFAGLVIPQAVHYVYRGYCVIGTDRPA
ncbi:unnamed protein product [Rhizoctonia solani]|uniref:Uncharacterized protein n=1 Tax=Rhizoctonia solani TaxID=456999 RepID=A0A8H3E714_9AGAM|nr:unnamed protein product [Rhizoctonia solani]